MAHSAKGEIQAQPYSCHVSQVSRMADSNAAGIAPYTKYASLLQPVVKYASIFHDLGKLDEENQKVLREGKGKLPINHVDGGVAHLLSSPSAVNSLAALAVYSHHLGLPSLPEESAKGTGKVFRDEALKAITDERLPEYLRRHASCIEFSLTPHPHEITDSSAIFMRMALSCLVDADHTDTARHYSNVVPEGGIALFPEKRLKLIDDYVDRLSFENKGARNNLRRKIYDVCRSAEAAPSGIIACDSPVGTGKTTAVMAHLLNVAHRKHLRRIFVVLPFTNIIDQSVDVYRKALVMKGETAEKVVAAHHHRAEFDNIETRVFSFLWNAPVTVTTAVQFFETLASNHPAALRKLHQMPGSAIFLDEAHAALPAHLWSQGWKWLQELVTAWGCYVVMASGSLTRFWELEEFSDPTVKLDELVTKDVRQKAHKAEKTRINHKRKDLSLALKELCEWIQSLAGPRLVILNTVQSAAALAEELAGINRKHMDKVEHLSSALAPIHRKKTLSKINERLKDESGTDWTLVATSCVEAGMDFSFRTAAREFCSLVSTIQTAGRINRSGGFQESCVWSFRIRSDGKLREHSKFRLSASILEDLFKENKVAPEYCKEAMRREIRQSNQGLCKDDPIVGAERNREFKQVEGEFKVIDDNTVTVVIDSELRRCLETGEIVSASILQQKSVNVFAYLIDTFKLKPFNRYPGLYWWTLAYDDFIGYMAGVLAVNKHESEGTII